ncbi:MAG: UDP-N-acetylglucosamine 1-carboxyvinyltransferase [Patescibacteria group bacterium]
MEEKFLIKGGHPLSGEIEIRGSKNAASKLMIATLLTDEPCVIENVPFSSEIDITRELCERIGSKVTISEDHTLSIATPDITTSLVPELSRKNRIPILAFGPLLHRKGFAEIPVLGGCYLGHRPINFHIEALSRMGVRIERREGSYYGEADRIVGNAIDFPYPSVGATENVLLTAVRAQGVTHIGNAAMEPEILNLIEMLNAMGGDIALDQEARTIRIIGVPRLKGVRMRVISDRNEIVSFAVAALATDGHIYIRGVEQTLLDTFLSAVRAIGGHVIVRSDGIEFFGKKPYKPIIIKTGPHPEFMTDWQQPFCILLTQANGESILHETVYEDRFAYTKDLKRMGADIEVSDECLGSDPCRFYGATFNHSVRVRGQTQLSGAEITMTDLRAGMAHMIAALSAEGESLISGIDHVDRGYEKIDERLRTLGADIRRIRV